MSENSNSEESMHQNIFDYFEVLILWKKFLLLNVLVVCLITIAVVLLMPKWYKATASIMPPKNQGLTNMMGTAGSVLKSLTGMPKIGGLSQGMGDYNYLAILKSRTTYEEVVKKFNLVRVYNLSDNSIEKAIKELDANVSCEMQDEDYLTIDVYDKDPMLAANIANYFVVLLNETSIKLATQEAKNNREFIEKRLELGKQSLREAEDSLRIFQEETEIIIDQEHSSGIRAIAELYGMKAKKEIELAVMEQSLTPDNDLVQQLKIELSEINKKISKIPRTGLDALRKFREVAIQQKIVEFLIPLYEQAKIDERKNLPVVLILDRAIPPEQKVKPQRSLIVISVTFISVFLFVLLAFMFNGLLRRGDKLNSLEFRIQKIAVKVARMYRIS